MPICWQGPKGVGETGVLVGGSQAGTVVVTVSPHYFRPVEVTNRLKAFKGCLPVCIRSALCQSYLIALSWSASSMPATCTNEEAVRLPKLSGNNTLGCCRAK